MDEILRKLYYDPKTGYVGIDGLYRKAKLIDNHITMGYVKKWMDRQESRQINKQELPNKKDTLPIFSSQGDSYQIDLTFFPKYKKQNKGYLIMMTCVNVNNRLGYIYKAKTKNTEDIIHMLNQFYKDTNNTIRTITSDNGSEFISKKVQEWFDKNNIIHYLADPGDHYKMGKIERFNRTIKQRLENHFIATESIIWYDVIDDIADNYNNTYHRMIFMSPIEMSQNEDYEKNYIQYNQQKIDDKMFHRYLVNGLVRILNTKKLFDKSGRFWSDDLYDIVEYTDGGRYILRKEGSDRPLKKRFRIDEIQVVTRPENTNIESNNNPVEEETNNNNPPPEPSSRLRAIRVARQEDKIQRLIKQAGVNENNIIPTEPGLRFSTRNKKQTQKLDL